MTAIADAKPATLHADTRGFDTNLRLSADQARAFAGLGYAFVGRYVRRRGEAPAAPNDLSILELEQLLAAGLGVIPIQHVESETAWVPSEAKGRDYGWGAVRACGELSIPRGTMVVCDLEGVANGVRATVVDAYCRAWWEEVKTGGYVPALYVGWRCGLGPNDLYRLPFERYLSAYNLDADQYPAVRGACMHQRSATLANIPQGVAIRPDQIDLQVVTGDALDGFPVALMPAPRVIA